MYKEQKLLMKNFRENFGFIREKEMEIIIENTNLEYEAKKKSVMDDSLTLPLCYLRDVIIKPRRDMLRTALGS